MTLIEKINSHIFNISPKTNWFFISITFNNGETTWGEASLNGWEPALKVILETQYQHLIGKSVDEARRQLRVSPRSPGGLLSATIVSAIQQALIHQIASAQKIAINQLLSSNPKKEVLAYANINRATQNRTAQGFIDTATQASTAGFKHFKLAPFDGLMPNVCNSEDSRTQICNGIDKILALCDHVDKNARVMIDCHWRFNEAKALEVLHALRDANIYWFECPMGEGYENWISLKRIRSLANELGIKIAAAETQIGTTSFEQLFQAGLYDIVMPDVKYCGGPEEMMAIASKAMEYGVMFSPHNPTGPICYLQSLHIACAADAFDMLEIQFNESTYSSDLISSLPIRPINSYISVPQKPGLGASINLELLATRPYQPVPAGIETQLNS